MPLAETQYVLLYATDKEIESDSACVEREKQKWRMYVYRDIERDCMYREIKRERER